MTETPLPLQGYLAALHAKYQGLREGAVATYIPELAKADPNAFGICLVTVDGYAYAVGDTALPFTIQSISKAVVYATALADRGRAAVLAKVGVEPSGEAFNSISLNPQTGAPLNPMINAGAIAMTGFVNGDTATAKWDRILKAMSHFVGHDVTVDEAVYRSESANGFRNRAIAWMLKNFGIIDGDPMDALENYFRQCAIRVTCSDLAHIAATFANGGMHPVTGKRAVAPEDVQSVLSIMATCGMYDYAGSWLYDVGLPAKSGVSGGVIAVMPGRFGIAIYSPPIDATGNSARGIAVCRQMSRDFSLHVRGVSISPSLVLGRVYSAHEAPSRRVRSPAIAARLRHVASQVKCVALQGDVAFDGAEYVVRRLTQLAPASDSFVLDMHRVSHVSDGAARLLHDVRGALMAQGKAMVFSRIRGRAVIEDALRHALPDGDAGFLSFEDNDVAVEWCEDRLLRSQPEASARAATLADFPLFAGMDADSLAELDALMPVVDYPAGATVISVGEERDDRVFFIEDGEVSVVLGLSDDSHQRIATLCGGMTFGEMAMLGMPARSASVHADTAVRCRTLKAEALDQLAIEHPEIKIAVLKNLSLDLAQKLRQANLLIGALAA
jgi:glutaminase